MSYKKTESECANCFRVFQQAYPGKKYCNRACYDTARYAKAHRICLICGKRFEYYKSRGAVKYCSRTCYFKAPISIATRQARAHHGENHPNWKGGVMKGRKDRNLAIYKNWRNAIFARDHYTCVGCGIKNQQGLGRTVRLEADHIKSWNEFPELRYEVSNGRTLCKECHSKRTAKQHKERMSHATV